jgi:hypothetical protein
MRLKKQFLFSMSGIAFLIAVLAQYGFSSYKKHKREKEFIPTLTTLIYLDADKPLIAIDFNRTNGYQVTTQEIAAYWGKYFKLLAPALRENESNGEVFPGTLDWVIYLNPIGTPAKIRFLRSVYEHPPGWEMAAPYAHVVQTLSWLETSKESVANERHWTKGHAIKMEDVLDRFLPLDPSTNYVSYTLNPVGIPPTARIVQALPTLPVGSQITTTGELTSPVLPQK